MRIISQDETVNIPFNTAVLWIKYASSGCEICAVTNSGIYFTMGIYSTKERACKVMRCLNFQYEGSINEEGLSQIFDFPQDRASIDNWDY